MSNEPWRSLKVGDRIRIVRMPTDFSRPGYRVARMTRALYRDLIARGRSVRIYEIDEWGGPWISCRFRQPDGSWSYHALCVDDDSWVKIKKRGT